jgi:pSer/pThr/pTyr-binding forkhead associated (FHA) protein/anti-anti-sigma regulatory factor
MIKVSAELPSGMMVVRVPELVMSIGRSRENVVVLNEPTVSSVHARLSWSGSRYRIEDLGSANGLWVDGVAVAEASVCDSLTFFLGAVRCVLEVSDPCFICNDNSRFLMAMPTITVGRAGDNNWVLACPSVSSHHLRLIQEGGQMFVQNLSEQGTRVGGLPITYAPIASGEVIQLGSASILYNLPPVLDEGFTLVPCASTGGGLAERFSVSGSLGREQASELADCLGQLLSKGRQSLALDMSSCTRLHPLCLDVLLAVAQTCAGVGGSLRLIAPSPAVARAVALANAGQRLTLVS